MRWILLSILMLLSSACVSTTPWVELQGRRFEVEIADTQPLQAQGLMFRDSLPADQGMLFIFRDEAPRSFWMRNTRIPLDIFYFDSELKLVSVAANARPCRIERCPGYPSEGNAQYVLELNAGLAAELGVEKGDLLTLHLD
jgi:uncharacterized membrane protein (UPF0127 family)